MTLSQFLEQLAEQGVQLAVDGHQLRLRAPKGVLTPALQQMIAQRKPEILAWLQADQAEAAEAYVALPQLVPAPTAQLQPFPLTDIQHAYWVGRSGALEFGNVAAHGYTEFEYHTLDVVRLQQAWQQLIRRHPMLRAVVLPDGQQQILAEAPLYQIPVYDLTNLSDAEQAAELARLRAEMEQQVRPAEQWPAFDFRVSRLHLQPHLKGNRHGARLHISIDLLMFDVASLQLLYNEWALLYENPAITLPPLELSFRDYVLAEKQMEATALYARARDYWLNRIATLPSAPKLPLAPVTAVGNQSRFKRYAHQLAPDDWQRLKQRAHQLGVTPSNVLLTAFAAVLATWSKEPRFTLNLTLFNRLPLHPQINALVGDFTTTNLLEVNYTTPAPFVEQAKALQRQLLRDVDQRYFGGIRVLRELTRRQGGTGQVLMPVVFTSALGLGSETGNSLFNFLGGKLIHSISQTPQVWLDHQVLEQDGALVFHWDVVDARFPSALIDAMFNAYGELLKRLATSEALWASPDLALVPGAQLAQRATVNATIAPVPDELLHTRFLHQVTTQPAALAVITPERTLTYQEVYDRANQVGHWLRTRGAQPNTLVAVVMAKSWEQVVAVLGIHLAGAAYLPIDPDLPTERQHYLLTQGEVTLALTQAPLLERLSWPAGINALPVDRQDGTVALPPLACVQTPTDLAYVIYTSGSTGLPKGVAIDHRGAVNTVLDINQRFGVTAQDRVLALSALNFDLSVYDIFGLLAVGGAIVLPRAELRTDPAHWLELMLRHEVTLWNSVPALLQLLVDYSAGQAISTPLRLVLLSGDWIPVSLPAQIRSLWPACQLISLGGATEASIWSIYYPIAQVDPQWTSIPYGQPLTNQTFHVLDDHFNPRPVWVPGHLYIGGIGLAQEYWRDPAKTAERFIAHPQTGERLYKTGDLGRYLPDGNIEFLGRADFQVKLHGHRIELGEIEATLLQHPGVKEAVVTAVGDPKSFKHLVAYLVPAEGEADSLFVVETMDEAAAQICWQQLVAARPEQVQSGNEGFSFDLWQQFNALYQAALLRTFSSFGLFQQIGELHTLDSIMAQTGIASRYTQWLRRALLTLMAEGWLCSEGDAFRCLRPLPLAELTWPETGQALLGRLDGIAWLRQSAEQLPDILTERLHSAQLYTAEAVPTVYQTGFQQANASVCAVVQALVENRSGPLRILEVGAGYGSTTQAVLPLLPPAETDYHFTDVSPFFLQRAETEFAAYPFMHYGLLDLEAAPEAQDYAVHSFDLILAASVLHVPRRIAETLDHILLLLKPGGILVMIEETQFQPAFDLSMGLQQGFERFADHELRPLHPLLSCGQWQQCLQAAGFVNSWVIQPPAATDPAPSGLGIDVLIAQGPFVTKYFAPQRLQNYLAAKLPAYMLPAHYVTLSALPLTANGKVDRQALPVPHEAASLQRSFTAPRTATETQLAALWCDLLRLAEVGIHENFFVLGGDSLLATQVTARLRAQFQVNISLQQFFEAPTIAGLAEQIVISQLSRSFQAASPVTAGDRERGRL